MYEALHLSPRNNLRGSRTVTGWPEPARTHCRLVRDPASGVPEHQGLSANEKGTTWTTREGGDLKRSASGPTREKESGRRSRERRSREKRRTKERRSEKTEREARRTPRREAQIGGSGSLANHRKHVKEVLQQLCKNQLAYKPEKCIFEVKEMEYLEFVLTPRGLTIDKWNPEKEPLKEGFQLDERAKKAFLKLPKRGLRV
ncbi:hypothetical protein NDU88_010313 [Pleurodeles waltl]|uniref:Uncharacterized protein n=1 Tax=Pleurodeles waltl TaxID=8319 RepID=A0AAV7S3M5_PLEWA|nr:hypothetical protein NDU88_010313 [Pleurodeles waltl]